MKKNSKLRLERFDIGSEPIGSINPNQPNWGQLIREVEVTGESARVKRCAYVGIHMVYSEKPPREYYVLESSGWVRGEPGLKNLKLIPLELVEGDIHLTGTISSANFGIKMKLSELLGNRTYNAMNSSRLPLKQ